MYLLITNQLKKDMNKFFLITMLIVQAAIAQNSLLIPSTLSGTDINLTLQNGTHQFYNGIDTNTMGANGNILGPTLILNNGDFVNFTVNNQLAETTTIHWHGLHVSPENDGGPHTTIAPNTTWNPSFTILDKASSYWYHPHLHEKTNEHVSKGISGLIIVKDAEATALNLPRNYGVDDFPLIIQTKDFDANSQIVSPSNSDDIIMVNATIDAALIVPEQVVRFRILNGSSMRVFNIGLSGNKTFYQIASDGGLLSDNLPLTRLQLASGERAEILVNFSGMNGQTVFLKSYASEFSNGIYGATNPGMGAGMTLTGYNPNPLNGTDFDIMQFNVGTTTATPVTTIASPLVTVTPIPEANSDMSRTITMSPVTTGQNQLNGNFYLNDVLFDMNVINETVPLDNTEIWTITNNSAIAHPFHIHDVQFYILDRDGNAPPQNEQGRKDVVLVKAQETIRFIAKFEDFSSTVPYMYHCHMLIHEDGGMMGQFVVEDALSVEENELSNKLKVYPNPANNKIHIILEGELNIDTIEIIDQLGRIVLDKKINFSEDSIQIEGLSKGVYFLRIYVDNLNITKKIVVK
ncbi:MAG: multicopper oxidase domain-containing protein [Flavobacteriaceae bacterium]|nr:multicopper oxidase domain-containing protein [Flavobacteriaceae bacterium]